MKVDFIIKKNNEYPAYGHILETWRFVELSKYRDLQLEKLLK